MKNIFTNPFEFSLIMGDERDALDIPARFLGTIYNLGLGFKDLDELDAVEVVMLLEDSLDGTGSSKRSK